MIKSVFSLFFSFLFITTWAQSVDSDISTYLKDEEIKSIRTDQLKRLYIIAKDTSYYFDNKNFLTVDQIPAAPENNIQNIEKHLKGNDDYSLANTISSATQLSDGRIIFTNSTGRLYQLYKQKIQRYLIPDFEAERLVINKLTSKDNMLMICTLNDGIYIWRPEEFRLEKLNAENSRLDNNINDAFLDDWGSLWLATDYGLKRIHYIDQSQSSMPKVYIEKMNVLYEKKELQDDILELQKSENNIQFHFGYVDYSESDQVSYEWRKNEQDAWASVNGDVISLTNLKSGNYNFQLRATNGNGLYGYADPVQFKIHSSLLDTAWPYVLFGIGLLTLLWLWSLVRHNRTTKTYQKERQKLILENQLLKTEQKALQLQMNPHFIFNALSSIQGLIASNENSKARKYLNKFATLMRSMLDQSRGESVTIAEEIKYLDDYLSLEQVARGDKFKFEIECPASLHEVEIPSMLLQPFVENAIMHGMHGLKHEGAIKVAFDETSEGIACVVEDNGVGRKASVKKDHKSVAIEVVRDRLNNYFKHRNKNTLEIIDKKDKTGNAIGTIIKIQLPTL